MKFKTTRVFITVKTYPTLSVKYDELVCTAGITDEGNWIRIYPVPFRKLDWEKQYKKYQWIEVDLIKNKSDFRPESYKPTNRGESIKPKEFVKSWEERGKTIFKEKVYTNMEALIREAKDKNVCTSLAIFKPKELVSFKVEPTKKKWDADKIMKIQEKSNQFDLFDSDKPHEIFQIVKKLPYKFSYVFTDDSDKQSTMMIEDWEIGALYWNCLKRDESEKIAIRKVKQRYFDEFKKKELHLFLGTTKKFHNVGPNRLLSLVFFIRQNTIKCLYCEVILYGLYIIRR